MRPRSFVFWCALVAIATLWGPAPLGFMRRGARNPIMARRLSQPLRVGPARPTRVRRIGCADDEEPRKSAASAPAKPYDWKASFAEYKVGKVARTADGHPDLQDSMEGYHPGADGAAAGPNQGGDRCRKRG